MQPGSNVPVFSFGVSIRPETDPFERADITSNTYNDWLLHHGSIMQAATELVGDFLKTFKEFPPRQKAASFTIEQAMAKMESANSGAMH
jgi:hypothetical protein